MKGIHDDIREDRLNLEGIHEEHGSLDASAHRFALVVSRYNHHLTSGLARAAIEALRACGARDKRVAVYHVPGAFEIPFAADQLARSGDVDAIIALGAVIRGETPHADLIAAEVTRALSEIGRRRRVPVLDGVVVTHNEHQAKVRCTGALHNRGRHAALAAVEMATLARKLP